MVGVLQAASRESLAGAITRLNAYVDSADASALARVGDDLFAFARLLTEEKVLRRVLADPSTPESARVRLAEQLLGEKLSEPALELVKVLVSSRWSRTLDLIDAAETLARHATLAVAEKDGTLDDIEDELFRFARILAREPELNALLSDTNTPAEGRIRLLDQIIGDRVSPVTAALLRQTVRLPRSRHLDVVAEELAELAAARRDRSVARVTAPVALTQVQEQKLTDSLSRLYGRSISLQIDLDEGLLGGLVVQVGSEVIDGSVAGKLAAARRALPR
ncbi:MAG: F-type H+-transporting ATPase subunit delta [Pseudonocardiales bacterium]|jgi:F-type H+-transporting ATPase subunit delta|nr:F-type H+-transporting ATPase subunit delta [Pseudonocardiales bacterium]